MRIGEIFIIYSQLRDFTIFLAQDQIFSRIQKTDFLLNFYSFYWPK
jgi:hypothetical protein